WLANVTGSPANVASARVDGTLAASDVLAGCLAGARPTCGMDVAALLRTDADRPAEALMELLAERAAIVDSALLTVGTVGICLAGRWLFERLARAVAVRSEAWVAGFSVLELAVAARARRVGRADFDEVGNAPWFTEQAEQLAATTNRAS